MKNKLMTLFTRTPLHVGAGSSVGAIDQPVVRERHTQFPVIPGSSIKGVLADLWNEENRRNAEGIRLFGGTTADDAKAGSLLIGEGKLLAFPVRSAKGCFAWITCPLALSRFLRDAHQSFPIPEFRETNRAFASEALLLGMSVVFEEYALPCSGPVDSQIVKALEGVCDDEVWKKGLTSKLAIVSDEMFAFFAKQACEIANHNCVDDETGVVKNGALFNQENVPSETLFYSVFTFKNEGDAEVLRAKLEEEKNLLQVGADMTTGLGWCSIAMKEVQG